jgi:ankyrin repeat protein
VKSFFLLCLLSTLITLITDLHAGPGEEGRPAMIPRFESWGDETDPFRTGGRLSLSAHGDLLLYDLDGSSTKLSTLWKEKPVLLVHSSLTCPVSRDNCPHVDRLKSDFGDQIEVVVLYTTEAHPIGSPSPYSEGGKLEWLTDRNIVDKILVDEPKTLKARLARAHEYRDKQQIKARLLVDSMDNAVWKLFGGGPNTGIFIDQKGRVAARQGWLKPSLMAGEIRSHFADLKRTLVEDALKKHGHDINYWRPNPDEIAEASKDVPEVLSYNINTKGACHDETLLHQAVKYRKPGIVDQILNLGAPLDGLDRSGLTPLHYALRQAPYDDEDATSASIDILLKKGASLRTRSDKLETATHLAVHSNQFLHVKLALKAGAPLDSYSIDGISPLHEALFQANDKIAQHLISKGASKDIFAAAALGDLKNVKRFLINKPEVWNSFQGDSGRTPLMYAAIAGKTEVVKFLLSKQTQNQKYSNEQLVSCLKKSNENKAIEAGLAIAKHALPLSGENSPPPSQSLIPQLPIETGMFTWEYPVFHEAATSNNSDLLAALLDRGWDIDELSFDEETALHHASESGSTKAIHLLLKRGADLDAKSGAPRPLPCGPLGRPERANKTPLHLAVSSGEPAAVEALVKYGAKISYNDGEGKTPLCHAFPNPYSEKNRATQLIHLKKIIRILIKAGANPDKPADCGKSYRDLAAEMIEKSEQVDGKWVELEKSPRSPELLKFLDEIKAP